jgi:hypothetical protein
MYYQHPMLQLLLPLLALTSAYADPSIRVEEPCPGPMRLVVEGLTPGAYFVLVQSRREGLGFIPAGACAGTPVAIRNPRLFVLTADTDEDGTVLLTPTVPDGACGRVMAVVDLHTCVVSPVASL